MHDLPAEFEVAFEHEALLDIVMVLTRERYAGFELDSQR